MESKTWNECARRASINDSIDDLYYDSTVSRALRIVITQWSDFFILAEKFCWHNWIFRGESQVGRHITSTLERRIVATNKVRENHVRVKCTDVKTDEIASLFEDVSRELEMNSRIRDEVSAASILAKYGCHFLEIDQKDTVGWLCVMQHYGGPTRLVDFTRSLFVALFFAFEKEKETDRVIWAIRADALRRSRFDLFHAFGVDPDLSLKYLANQCIQKQQKDVFGIIPLEFPGNNIRIKAQNGLFLCPCTPYPFEVNLAKQLGMDKLDGMKGLDSYTGDIREISLSQLDIIQIVLSNRLYPQVQNVLKIANIDASTIRPDLSGLVQAIGDLYRP